MTRRRWLIHIVLRALGHRTGRTALLLAVLAMASSLATALGIVSLSMEKRVAEEVRKYGANLVIVPETARMTVGSGGLNFGEIGEPVYLEQRTLDDALARSGVSADRSLHLRVAVGFRTGDIMAEGVMFPDVRRLFPWWQVRGNWPAAAGEIVLGGDLAARYRLKPGDVMELSGAGGRTTVRIVGIVSTGGEEDDTLFMPLPELQRLTALEGRVTMVRLLVSAGGTSLKERAARLQGFVTGARVSEVRQIARTSEGLLAKVRLLMVLVTVVVLVSAGSSVAGTMSTTVLERSREIGLLKAIGGSRWEVVTLFSAEAMLLGFAGGLAGYAIGSVIARFITRAVFAASSEFIPWIGAVSLGVSLFLALLGSLGPMISVFRLDPVRSLRGE
jgi:putative ABC transport system permease protein